MDIVTSVDKSTNGKIKVDRNLKGTMIEIVTPPRIYYVVVPDDLVDAWIAALRSWIPAASPAVSAPVVVTTAAASTTPSVVATTATSSSSAAASAATPAPQLRTRTSTLPGGLGGDFLCGECNNRYPSQDELDKHCQRRAHNPAAVTAAVAVKKAPPTLPSDKPSTEAKPADSNKLALPGAAESTGSRSPRLQRSPRVSANLADVVSASRVSGSAAPSDDAAPAVAAVADNEVPVVVAPALMAEPEHVEVALESLKAFVAQSGFTVLPFGELFQKFKQLDKKDGAIDKSAFCALVKGMFGPDQDELLHAIFEYVDIDNGGTIDAPEVLCMLNLFCSGTAEEKLRVCFEAFDLDNSGSLDSKEFHRLVLYSLSRSRALLEELLGAFYPESMSPDDATMVRLPKVNEYESQRVADDAFAAADQDGSGAISESEFIKWALENDMFADYVRTHERVFGFGAAAALVAELAPRVNPDDVVRVSRRGVEAFVAQTGFTPLPFADLVAKMGQLLAGVNKDSFNKEAFGELMAGSFASDQHDLLDALFDFMDVDESGDLDPAEVLCTLNLFAYGSIGEKLRLCFTAYDDDKGGTLDLEEFQKMLESTLIRSRNVFVELIGAFSEGEEPDATDTSSTAGMIELLSLNTHEVRGVAERTFAAADHDGSGSIEFQEFANWATSSPMMLDFFGTHARVFGAHPDDASLGDDSVRIAVEGVRQFVAQTGFKALPFATVVSNYRAAHKGKEMHKEDFIALVKDMFGPNQEDLIDAIFDYQDIDNGGTLDAGEVLCMLNVFCSGSAAEKAKVCFEAFDDDQSHSLDRAEFIKLFETTLVESRTLLEELLGVFLEESFNADEAEVITLAKVSTYDADRLANTAFDEADHSGDGKVSEEEFLQFAGKDEVFRNFFATHERLFSGRFGVQASEQAA
jgi:Ca2+-binding EF-hand superfamily protein